ncbi:hypothetical protein [Sphingopyxis sp.]|uniref:hypothetical protein n=1 Tax=Sphingopyxis sp. TaxID=1908224 RepID=UPI0025F83E3B|nr:hypothetical protein [Sphingopyxis sp.]MBK6413720.1 hypothetical protein [Sphingopyxis sp.]
MRKFFRVAGNFTSIADILLKNERSQTEKPRLTANERIWHGPCNSVGIHRMARMEGSRKENIMAHFNVDSFKSYAIAAVASLYCSIMFLAAAGPNGLVA